MFMMPVMPLRSLTYTAEPRIGGPARDVLRRRIEHQVQRAGFQLHGGGGAVAHDADVELVKIRVTVTPVVLVACEIDVVADAVVGELEGTGADPLRWVPVGASRVAGVTDVEELEEVENARPRAVEGEDDGVLVGGVDVREPLALLVELVGVDGRVAHANAGST